jgi:selenocysteine lyase/cysteine desulfurase
MPGPAIDAMLDYLKSEQEIGGYETAMQNADASSDFYIQAANAINASSDEIAYCESASKAWQLFFYSIPFTPGDRIITTQLDYGSNFVGFIQQHNRLGVEVDVVETDSNGDIDLDAMEKAINRRTRLISLSHIPTANGIINPAARVGQLARSAGVPFLLDACQSVGQVNVDVKEIGCTALTATGRKYLRGPRGTGFLYVSSAALGEIEPGWLDQHGVKLLDRGHYELLESARRFENFEVGYAARIGLGEALRYFNRVGPTNVESRVVYLGNYCRERLCGIPQVTLHDNGSLKGGIVMFSLKGWDPPDVRDYLHQHQINVWASSGPGSLIDFQTRGLQSLIRASVHYFNTEEEIDRMATILKGMPAGA